MKDQYFGDVNDYRKYGLLRALIEGAQVRLGVCWLRTTNDGSRDGERRQYLRQPARWRGYDPDLYDALRRLLAPRVERTVVHAEAWELLPRARYHHEFLGDASSERQSYFASAWQRLRDTPLLFLDPDKGLEVPSVAYGRRTSASYLYWHEVDEAYRLGHSLVLYQHFRRTKRGPFVTTLTDSLRRRLAGCRVESFRSASAVYLVAARPEHAASLQRGCDLVRHRWQRQIQCTRGDKPVTSP